MTGAIKSSGRYIGYARVSTEDQNLDLQRDALEKHGVERIYTDKMSGAQMDRTGLKRALKIMRKGDVLVVWKLDRLGRSVQGILEVIGMMKEQGVGFKSITEPFDTESPYGTFMMHLLSALAELERNIIAERTKAGIKAYQERGGRMGRKHFVLSFPKRKALAVEWFGDGTIYELTATDAIADLHAVDPDAPEIKRTSSWYNWRNGKPPFKGLEEPVETPLDDIVDEGE